MSRKTRKLIWSAPLVAVLAVAGALAMFAALQPNQAAAHDVPGAPMNLEVEPASGPAGRTALVLTWSAPADGGAESYRIDMSSDGAKWMYHKSVTQMTYTHMGLDPDTRRYYRVFAVNSAGTGPVSRDVSGSTNKVSAPAKVALASASPKGPTQINLSWTMPDDGGASITKYCISVHHTNRDPAATEDDVSDENCLNAVAATTATDVTGITDAGVGIIVINAKDSDGEPVTGYQHMKLRAKQKWSYKVWAVNSVGRSKLVSDQRQAETASAMRPNAPTHLTLIQVTDNNTVELYWNGPVSDGGQDIVGFRVEVSDTSGQWPAPPETPTATADFTGAKTNTTAIAEIGGTTAMGLAINLPPITDTTVGRERQLSHSEGSLDGKTLRYRVRTETGDPADRMTSLWSDTVMLKLKPIAEVNRITGTTITPTVENDNKTGQIKLTFTDTMRQEPDDDAPTDFVPTGYRVDVSTDGGLTWQTQQRYTRRIDGNEFEQLGLKPGTEQYFRVFAWDGSDLGQPTASDDGSVVMGTAGPVKMAGAVGSMTATTPALPAGAGQLDLSWTTPSNDGGGKITRYCIRAIRINADGADIAETDVVTATMPNDSTDDNTADDNCTSSTNPTNAAGLKTIREANAGLIVINAMDSSGNPVTGYEHKGLTTGHRWKYTVYPVNSRGYGTASDTVDEQTGKAAKPAAPKNFTAEPAHDSNLASPGDRGVVLLWTSPDNPPGAPVTGYRVQLKKDDGVFETVHTTNSYTHWVDRSQPKDGEMRTYRVLAVNSVGYNTNVYAESKFSVSGTGDDQMLIRLPEHMHDTTLMAPTNVMASSDDSRTLNLKWEGAENAEFYVLVAVDIGAYSAGNLVYEKSTVTDPAARMGDVTALTPGNQYLGMVFAGKGSGADLELLFGLATPESVTAR